MGNIHKSNFNILFSKGLHIIGILFFSAALYYSYSNVSFANLSKILHLEKNVTLVFIITSFSILLLLVGYLINRYLTGKQFIFFLFFLAFGLRLCWILWIETPIVSDFLLMYHAALDGAKGNYSFSQTPYFSTWVYQLGFTMYQSLIIRITGDNVFVLKLLNVLYSTGITLIIYGIAARTFNEYCGRIAGVVYALYIPAIVMCSVLSNDHLSTFLFYLGIYLLIYKGFTGTYTWIFAGLLFSLGDIIRPLGNLVLVAVGVYLLIQLIGSVRENKWKILKQLTGILVVFFFMHYLVSSLFMAEGITQYPLSNRDPLWKFVVGLNHETAGQYSAKDGLYFDQFKSQEERKQAEQDLIKERLSDKQKLLVLFKNKFQAMWGARDDSIFWSMGPNYSPLLQNALFDLERLFFISMALFGILSSVKLLIRDNYEQSALILLLIAGYAAVHLLIEIQTRYRYFIIPSLVIMQSYGIFTLSTLLRKFVKTKEINN